MEQEKLHLPRIEDLLRKNYDTKKRPINYANYTHEDYNILTLDNYNDYYRDFKKKIPVYVREQPDWSKSLYRKKNNKVTKYNYFIHKNAKNISRGVSLRADSRIVPRDSLYKPLGRGTERLLNSKQKPATQSQFHKTSLRAKSVAENLPLLKNNKYARSNISTVSKRSLSLYSASNKKAKSVLNKSAINDSGKTKFTRAELLIKRAEQLGKFMQSVKSEEGKKLISEYGKKIIENTDTSDITKEQMKIALEKPVEDLQKLLEDALGVKLDNEEKENKDESEKTESVIDEAAKE